MVTFIVVYHGRVVIINEINSYEFVGMKETILLNKFPTHANVVRLVRYRLGWMDEGCEVRFEGRIDIESSIGLRIKMISPVYNENEWTAYVGVVMKSKIHGIELVARMVVRNDVGDESSRSPTLFEAADEQHVEYDVLLTQPSQEIQDKTAKEPPFISSNETVEHVYESVGVCDVLHDTGFISSVDP
jgi:hypothetical protein